MFRRITFDLTQASITVLAALLVAALGCSLPIPSGGGEATPPAEASPPGKPAEAVEQPVEQPAEQPTEQPADTVTLTLINNTNVDVCAVYMSSPAVVTQGGYNWLEGSSVPPGGQHDFSLAPGTWEMEAADCTGNRLSQQSGYNLTADDTWVIEVAGPVVIELIVSNNSNLPITDLRMSLSSDTQWGDNWLVDGPLAPGASVTYPLDEGTWDIMALDDRGNVLGAAGELAVSGSVTWEVAGQFDQAASVTVVNNSGTQICYVNISPSESWTWGFDRLDSSTTIPAGTQLMISSINSGVLDLKAEDCDHNVIQEDYEMTVSGSMTWTVTGN